MLYLVATPIGNLQDITYRAVETLKNSDYILCEDTRHSLPLLRHYEIHKPLYSYHKFNEETKAHKVIEDLKAGKQISLISDAGTPGISDPGASLVALCVEEGIAVTAIPGPCAAIQALSCSGLSTERFQFVGFLPRKGGSLRKELEIVLSYPGTTICYESPKRLIDTLRAIQELDPTRQLVVARELTKKFEEWQRGTAEEVLTRWHEEEPRGEIVLLIAGGTLKQLLSWEHLSVEEHVAVVEQEQNIGRQEAIKVVARLRGVPKREIYQVVARKEH